LLSVVVTEVYDDFILVIDMADINHIKNVFRKVKGDKIRAVDGTNEYLCEIEKIEDPKIRFCEEAFLDGYRRREFTEMENLICSDFFAQKIEDELNYKKQVL